MKPAPTLIAWLLALEAQTPHRIKCFVTNISELASLQIQQRCTQKGILHLLVTAPYTSPPAMVGLNDSTALSWTKLAPCAPPAKKVNGSADFHCSSDEIANNTSQVRYHGLRDNYSQLDGHANSSFGQ